MILRRVQVKQKGKLFYLSTTNSNDQDTRNWNENKINIGEKFNITPQQVKTYLTNNPLFEDSLQLRNFLFYH